MILLIDNYDSFTYNLVQRFGEIDPALPMTVARNDQITLAEIEAMNPTHIIISPGPCTPKEAGISNDVLKQFAPSRPVFGVCLGHQCIGHSFGGEVVRNERIMHGKVSPVFHDGRGVFAGLSKAAPCATGLTGYVQAGLGPFFGSQVTISFWTTNWVGNVAIALAVAGAAGYLVPALAGPGPRLALTLASIWLAVAASWLGPRTVARVEGLTLGVGLLPVLLAATFGWLAFHPTVFLASWNPHGLQASSAVGASALAAFWAFLGVECAAAGAASVRDPARNIPRATLFGVVGVALLYISASSVLMGIIPATDLAASSAPFANAAKAMLGVGLGGAIAVCALLRAQGCLTGWTLVTSETTRTGADQGAFPGVFRTRPGERARRRRTRSTRRCLLGAGSRRVGSRA